MNERRIYKEAVETFGKDAQIELAIEECGELVAKLAKIQNDRFAGDEEELEIIEYEIADVIIMMEQMKLMVGEEKIERSKNYKLDRLQEKINHHQKEEEK